MLFPLVANSRKRFLKKMSPNILMGLSFTIEAVKKDALGNRKRYKTKNGNNLVSVTNEL